MKKKRSTQSSAIEKKKKKKHPPCERPSTCPGAGWGSRWQLSSRRTSVFSFGSFSPTARMPPRRRGGREKRIDCFVFFLRTSFFSCSSCSRSTLFSFLFFCFVDGRRLRNHFLSIPPPHAPLFCKKKKRIVMNHKNKVFFGTRITVRFFFSSSSFHAAAPHLNVACDAKPPARKRHPCTTTLTPSARAIPALSATDVAASDRARRGTCGIDSARSVNVAT